MSEYTGMTPPGSWGFPSSPAKAYSGANEDTQAPGADEQPQTPGAIQEPDATEAPQEPEIIQEPTDSAPAEESTAPPEEPTVPAEESTAPAEDATAPTEEVIASTEETAADARTEEAETYETLGVEEPSAYETTHIWCLIIIGVLAALCLGLLIALITGAFRPRKRRSSAGERGPAQPVPMQAPSVPQPAAAVVGVGKLHYQGDRESQQDCMAVTPLELGASQGVLAVVADGMGGLSDGDQMSQAAVTAMMDGFLNARESDPLALTIRANQAVNNLLGPSRLGASGTTLVAGIARSGLLHYVSVGDSRICLYRRGSLIQLNREHIYRNELATQAINGMGTLWDASSHPKAGGLTSYLGMGELKYVDIPAEPLRLERGDKVILMSDGVYNALTQAELESALGQPAQSAADSIARMIQNKAYRNQDNYTAVILEF